MCLITYEVNRDSDITLFAYNDKTNYQASNFQAKAQA